jgi:thioredoxin reductase/ferredoxin
MGNALLLVYAAPLVGIWVWYIGNRRAKERANRAIREKAYSSGLAEPVSLHPVIDPVKCIGCGSCVKACPEQPEHHVLGLIGGKAQLIGPSDCIGHGACRAACPADAITLVFGTEKRGVDIPLLSPTFETTVPGVYVAGELGGMGLIRNALSQGRQAVDAIHQKRPKARDKLDLVIVGAGPAGFSASLAAKSHGMKFVTVEQESLGGCVFQYPRAKLVMTSPAEIPMVGKVKFTHTSKEELLEFWTSVERKTGVGEHMKYRESVSGIDRDGANGFIVRTSKAEYRAHSVLLAIGRRGTPRKLDVPGETLPKVVYRLIDPDQYRDLRVLVVGGGDSALEAAASIAEAGCADVTLSYRGDAFTRAKQRNRERIAGLAKLGKLKVFLESNVRRIETDKVILEYRGSDVALDNDAVIVSAGGILPTDFLRKVGVDVETKYGTA